MEKGNSNNNVHIIKVTIKNTTTLVVKLFKYFVIQYKDEINKGIAINEYNTNKKTIGKNIKSKSIESTR